MALRNAFGAIALDATLAAVRDLLSGTLKTAAAATSFTDRTVAPLSLTQAAGTASVIAANATRKVFAITPTTDGRLYIASAAGNGFYWPLYAGVTRVLSGAECPTNALFVTGQTAATALPMAEG